LPRILCLEKASVAAGLSIHAGNLTARTHT
jgi:hypothetical protein